MRQQGAQPRYGGHRTEVVDPYGLRRLVTDTRGCDHRVQVATRVRPHAVYKRVTAGRCAEVCDDLGVGEIHADHPVSLGFQ